MKEPQRAVKSIAILGATGSIGRSTLDVVRSLGPDYRVVGLSAGSNWEALAAVAAEFRPRRLALADERSADMLTRELKRAGTLDGTDVLSGPKAADDVASAEDTDTVVSAIVGAAGLEPTLAAVRTGKRVALANKEALVMAGGLVMDEARRSGATLLPVDSEHSAIFQAKLAGKHEEVRRIVLTASGGPFRERDAADFAGITPDEALRHPTWSMGPKITVDSATLMNKALEIIEARWLFDLDPSRIEVWIHPQSVVHSMVEFVDGSIVAQLGRPDMRLPIQYALTFPERLSSGLDSVTVTEMSRLTFERPDTKRFPALSLGYRAAREGGTAGAALSAANEVAVEAFLQGRLSFADIPRVTARAMDCRVTSCKAAHSNGASCRTAPSNGALLNAGPLKAGCLTDDIWEADTRARDCVRRLIRGERTREEEAREDGAGENRTVGHRAGEKVT